MVGNDMISCWDGFLGLRRPSRLVLQRSGRLQCVAIVNWVLALSGCDDAASELRDENTRLFKHLKCAICEC